MSSMRDIRNERTERGIRKAMLSLLEDKPFSQLTITDVAVKAGISRSTFYAHYANTQEVFEELVREFHGTVRDLESQLRCEGSRQQEVTDKLPYCMALRNAGPYRALVRDPHYLSVLQSALVADLAFSDYGNPYKSAGVGSNQAASLYLFQMVGCYTAAMQCPDNATWEQTRQVIDAFIRSGMKGIE